MLLLLFNRSTGVAPPPPPPAPDPAGGWGWPEQRFIQEQNQIAVQHVIAFITTGSMQ